MDEAPAELLLDCWRPRIMEGGMAFRIGGPNGQVVRKPARRVAWTTEETSDRFYLLAKRDGTIWLAKADEREWAFSPEALEHAEREDRLRAANLSLATTALETAEATTRQATLF